MSIWQGTSLRRALLWLLVAESAIAGPPVIQEPGKTTEKPILAGVSNSQSGASGWLGRDLVRGSLAYFQLVNAAGGIRHRPIRLVIEDDHYEPGPAVHNTNLLIQRDQVLFLFDYVGTPTLTRVLPLLQYYASENIVNVGPFTGAEPQRKPPYDRFVFNIRCSYEQETQAMIDYLYGKGLRKIGFMGQADAFGKSGEIGIVRALARHGLKASGVVTYRRNQSTEVSMQEQVDLLRKSGAEAVLIFGVYGPCARFIRDARLSGWNVPVATVSFVGADQLQAELIRDGWVYRRDFTKNVMCTQVVPPPGDTRYPMVAAFKEHMPPGTRSFTALEGWLNAVVVTEGLRRTEDLNSRASFIRAMESIHNWDPGIGQKIHFSRTNHEGINRVWLTELRRQHWEPIGDLTP